MATLESAAARHAATRAATAQTVAASQKLWAKMSVSDLDASWAAILSNLLTSVISGQVLVAAGADDYVAASLAEQSVKAAAKGSLAAAAFAGVGGDGYPLSGMLLGSVTWTKQLIGQGNAPVQAFESGRIRLGMLAATAVQDAGRAAERVAIASRPKVTGFVRTLSPPSCSRCAVLAGRWYRWNASFDRHPRCDCGATPAAQDASDLRTNPRTYFDSLTKSDQDRLFTNSGAEAIRSGADIGQVVNARRGMQTATAYGRSLTSTTEGTTRTGAFGAMERARVAAITGEDPASVRLATPRLMPESIFAIAGDDRAHAIRLLGRFGFLSN